MKKLILTLALAIPAFANPALFTKYETVRQGFLKESLRDVQASARALASEATKAKKADVARRAEAVAKSTDLAKARASFAALSDEMIQLRNAAATPRPAVYYCSMLKKSWLQPKGTVGNPYDAAMKGCGEVKAE